jgi:SAM-dependent methyltransferase
VTLLAPSEGVDTALVHADGHRIPLDVARWRRDLRADEWELLSPLADPVLDIGCGPGRAAAALAAAGRPCLGIDPAPSATHEARRRGANVVTRSVFDRLPGEGRWGGAVLLDGNVGIGGRPDALLARVRELLRPGGRVLVELDAPGRGVQQVAARLEVAGRPTGPWFPWAYVAADAFTEVARESGLGCEQPPFVVDGRWFAFATTGA